MPSPNTCMNSCYTDPMNPNCSCDIEPCDLYTFVSNIWFTKDNDDHWDDPGYINFSIASIRSTRPDDFIPSNGVCGSTPSPTNVYQGNIGDFRIVLDATSGLWGQTVNVGTDGDQVTYGDDPSHINGLIITRVRSAWGNPAGMIFDYDNIGPSSLEPNGIFGGINYELSQRGKIASSVIAGRSTIGTSTGIIPGEILAEVRAKFHGGSSGGFDTKFQPLHTGVEGECDVNQQYRIDSYPQQTWDDNMNTLFGNTSADRTQPDKCGYWDETFGMGGMCSDSAGCDGSDYSKNSNHNTVWGTAQSSTPTGTDWDGINHYWIANPNYSCTMHTQGDDGVYLCEYAWPGTVPPRRFCNPAGYCQRGLGEGSNSGHWHCGGLTEPNTHEYCEATYCQGNESSYCPSSVFNTNQLTYSNLLNETFVNKYYNRIRYEDCLQGNYDCISGDKERTCSNPHTGGDEGWCYEFNHPFGQTSSTTWPVSGVGFPSETFTFDIVDDPMCLPNDISSDLADSVCATYFHTFVADENGGEQVTNWAWLKTDWSTRLNYKDGGLNCDGGNCEAINSEFVIDNVFGCTDPTACNYCSTCVEHHQSLCDYGDWYCPILGANETDGCRPCTSHLPDDYDGDFGANPGVNCSETPEQCVPIRACPLDAPDSSNWSTSCSDIDHDCSSDTYDDSCGLCCGENTQNPSCDPDHWVDCNGLCPGDAGYGSQLDDCGDCDGGLSAYFASCIGGRTWSTAEQEQLGLNCSAAEGMDSNCCCGTMQSGASSSYTGCDASPPKFYYYDSDGDGQPCEGNVDYVLSCGAAPANYVEGPAPSAINQSDYNNIICSDGQPCAWADLGWDLACDCAANFFDDCGVCGGNGSSCEDCTGVSNGSASFDSCNNCIKCCTPEEEQLCGGHPYCTNPIFNSSSCMHYGNDPSNQVPAGNYPEENIAGGAGAPAGECKGDGWFGEDQNDWTDKWCECYTWCASDCGGLSGTYGDPVCSSNGGEELTGWDYKAWDNRVYDQSHLDPDGNPIVGRINWAETCTGSNRCGQGDRTVKTTKQIYNVNNQIVGSYTFNYTPSGPGALNINLCQGQSGDLSEYFAGYCGGQDSAGNYAGSHQYWYYKAGGKGKIQQQANPKMVQSLNVEPSIRDEWRSQYAYQGITGLCYYSNTADCSHPFTKERSCENRVGMCGVCAGGQPATVGGGDGHVDNYIDYCEVCGGDGSSCGGGLQTCNNNCFGTSTGEDGRWWSGGSYLDNQDCDCSFACVWFRDCCDYRWSHCAWDDVRGQIGFGTHTGANDCVFHNWDDTPCADCMALTTRENMSETYTFWTGNLINPTVKECNDGAFNTGAFQGGGGSQGMMNTYPAAPPDAWCEMVAAAGFVSGGNENDAHGVFYDSNLSVSGDNVWASGYPDDTYLKTLAPWFYCAVEACCNMVWSASNGSYTCIYYGGGGSSSWYDDGTDCDHCQSAEYQEVNGGYGPMYRNIDSYLSDFPDDVYAGGLGPYIPGELVDAGLISANSHCPVRYRN